MVFQEYDWMISFHIPKENQLRRPEERRKNIMNFKYCTALVTLPDIISDPCFSLQKSKTRRWSHYNVSQRMQGYKCHHNVFLLKVNNKSTKKTCKICSKFLASLWCLCFELRLKFTPFSSDSIAEYEHANLCWETYNILTHCSNLQIYRKQKTIWRLTSIACNIIQIKKNYFFDV